MKRLITLACFIVSQFVASGSVRAADETPVGYHVTEDVVYGHKDGLALTLDVIEPLVDRKAIGLVLISSGSWVSRKSDVLADEEDRRQNDHWVQGLLKGGFTLFVVRHGSAPRYNVPEMTPDILRSVRYVRAHAEQFKINPAKIGITSGSSGGHLALMAALKADDGDANSKDPIERVSSRTQAVVAWFPPTDLVNWGAPKGYALIELTRPGFFKKVLGEVTDLEPQLRDISPINFVTADSPPLFLIHGDADKTVPLQQSRIMAKKYEDLGCTVKLLEISGVGHSSWPNIMDQYPNVWLWFNQHLK